LDDDGRRTGHAAWVASPQGFWMSHVLLPDDGGRKRDMLLGLMAAAVPELWGRAAWRRIQETGSLGGAAQPAELAARVRAQAQAAPGRAAVEQQVAAALAAHAEAVRAYQAGDYRAADLAARAAGEHFTHALAQSLQPVAGEFRGVWDHDGLGWHDGDWRRTCRELKGFGFNAVLSNVAWPGKIHYAGAAWPRSARFAQYGDLLAAAIQAAHREKLAVHAWKICWNLTAAEPDLIRALRRAGRLIGDDGPAASPWLNPADPRNRAAELAAVIELATQYDVAGVHLDYIRYPTGAAGYDAATRRSFAADRGGAMDPWPAAILPGGARHAEFTAWRCAQITSFLAEVRAALRAAAPDVKLSVAVFGNYPETRVSIGQDWGAWLAQDLVDFVCPMNYTTDAREFRELVARQVALPGAAGRLYPGLGITASATQLDGLGALTQVQTARELGARGFVLFQLDAVLREQILPLFAEGLTRE
ncbi:MAG: family 10 glycosylhydrolase, partial [Candidatus Marinimicrobia bacterium]|nr:family 10 glycosylhydrolase [Candidatus Neomarinimicrobiota bacterium]